MFSKLPKMRVDESTNVITFIGAIYLVGKAFGLVHLTPDQESSLSIAGIAFIAFFVGK